MNFEELMYARYSLRDFAPVLVPKDTVVKIAQAGVIAPTAANKQPFKLIVVEEPQLVEKIKEAYPRDWFQSVNQLFVVVGDHQTSWKRADGKDHCDIDVAIVVDHLTLMAAYLGVGTCWVCNFNAEMVSKLLNLPSHLEPMVLLPFGYPNVIEIPTKKRRSLEELISWNGL